MATSPWTDGHGDGDDAPVARMLAADTLDEAVGFVLPELAARMRVSALALFLVDGAEFGREFWYPDTAAVPAPQRPMFRHEARRRLREAGSDVEGVRSHVLAAGGRVRAVVTCTDEPHVFPEEADSVDVVLRALAWRIAAEQEAGRAVNTRSQYERWFRTLDEQLRVLDRERQKFAAIVHRFDATVFVTDPARRIRWTNTIMSSQTPPGPEGSSWIGQSCSAVCSRYGESEAGEECANCPLRGALESHSVVHREYRDGSPGEERTLYLSALPIKGPDGKPHEVMVLIQDLSDLEIIRKSESRYRLLFERSSRAIVMVDPDTGRILLANPMATRLTGQSHRALHGMSLEGLHDPAEWESVRGHYERAMDEGSLAQLECRLTSADGTERHAIVSGTRCELGSQEVLMLEYEDVTESRRVQHALRRTEERLGAVVGNAPVILFMIDREGIFTLSEGRALDSLGLEPGQVVGCRVDEVYAEHPDILASVRRALAGEEFTATLKVGPLAFETRYTPVRGAEGEVEGLIGVATDVSDRHQLEDQLRHAQRMEAIGRLAGGVAHDFNNLLAAILGHGELMISELPESSPLRRNAEEIQKAGVRGALLTRQLLAFSRKEVLSPAVHDLNALVLGMEEMLRRLIGEDIEFVAVPSTSPARVRADRGQLEQIIMNLSLNARDAMPEGGRLSIEVDRVTVDESYSRQHVRVKPGEYCVLAVSDSGCGMDEETVSHVFEPFYTTKEPGKGTGLGLATVYGVVEQSGGHVWVYSEPDVGTTFKVYLPESEELPRDSQQSADDPLLRGAETVLLVEDEDTVRAVAREVLEANGYHVLEAANGVDALRLAASSNLPIHLLVSDVVMPQMGGGELAERLLEMRGGVRVLFISGYTDDAVIRHGVREHGTAFLQKPFSLDAFARKVREVLDTPQPPSTAEPSPGTDAAG